MCGIAGEVSLGRPLAAEHVPDICDALVHRGPDEDGFYHSPRAVLGIRRLKIIGLQGGSQPSYNSDRTIICVFNGEIYNYRVLRDRLARLGHHPGGTNDAHIIPLLYEVMGAQFVDELQGMFAIALLDTRADKLLLVTDRVGKKPIFYSVLPDDRVVFSSELGALVAHPELRRDIDNVAIDQYLSYRIIPAPRTVYQRVKKVPPATVMTFQRGNPVASHRYWRFDFGARSSRTRSAACVDSVAEMLEQAVQKRLEAEVPIGATLSGGLDSSLVVAIASRLLGEPMSTFSVGFAEKDFDESTHAALVAEHCGTRHHSYRIEPSDAYRAIDAIVFHMGEPYGFPSAIASYYMFELASRHARVVLTGDGADEIFCGYNRYKIFKRLPRIDRADYAKLDREILSDSPSGIADRYQAILIDGLRHGLKRRLYSTEFRRSLPEPFPFNYLTERFDANRDVSHELDRVMELDCGFWLPDAQLVKIDRMAMAHSVEPRSPMLDHRFVELACELGPDLKLVDDTEKYILRQVAERYLPASIVNRRKQELAVPLEDWLTTKLRDLIQATLLSEQTLERGYFSADALRGLVTTFRREDSYALWTIFMLEQWHRRFGGDAISAGETFDTLAAADQRAVCADEMPA